MKYLFGMAALCALLPAQRTALTYVDGRQEDGQVIGLTELDGAPALRIGGPAGSVRSVPLRDLLSVHGPAPRQGDPATVLLVGGEEIRGELRAGDAAGESFEVRSPSLGNVSVLVDRLRTIRFRALAGDADPTHFQVPDDADQDEALFIPARRGFDTVLGAIHRFSSAGVVFQVAGSTEPQTFSYGDLAGLALRGGVPREVQPTTRVLTRSGDRIHADLIDVTDGRLTLRFEGDQDLELAPQDLSAMTFAGPDRVFLSDLEPVEVIEKSYFAEGGEPLLPFVRDRDVTGGYLVAGGLTWDKGLGVHSRCILRYRVPDGVRHFHTVVAFDDEVSRLRVRGQAHVAVRHDDAVLFEEESLRSGAPPVNLGLLRVEPGSILTLEVDYGAGLDLGDRIDWLGAVFLR